MPLLDLFWTTLILFGWILWFLLLFRVYGDLFSRRDISGWVKTAWVVFTLVLPMLGVFAYLVGQGHGMAERAAAAHERRRLATDDHIRSVAAAADAQQGAKARELLQNGTITPAEYEQLVPSARS
jgi:biopolymer transport protein ExbB/TolQ